MPILERKDIEDILPHRKPFLFVDRITEIVEGTRIRGELAVDDTAEFSTGSEGSRVLPATILAEAMAQVGAILVLHPPENRGRTIYFRSIEDAEFKKVVPADAAVRIEAEVRKLRSRYGTLTVHAESGGSIVASAVMSFALG